MVALFYFNDNFCRIVLWVSAFSLRHRVRLRVRLMNLITLGMP